MVEIAYVDSSVLVKHYVESEKASAHASRLITDYKVYVSIIVQVEVLSALARKLHLQEATIEDVKRVKNIFLSDCQRIGLIEVSEDVIKEAQSLVFKTTIKTLDAIHLSSLILLRKVTDVSFPFITADKRLASAAKGEGFEVIGVGI